MLILSNFVAFLDRFNGFYISFDPLQADFMSGYLYPLSSLSFIRSCDIGILKLDQLPFLYFLRVFENLFFSLNEGDYPFTKLFFDKHLPSSFISKRNLIIKTRTVAFGYLMTTIENWLDGKLAALGTFERYVYILFGEIKLLLSSLYQYVGRFVFFPMVI